MPSFVDSDITLSVNLDTNAVRQKAEALDRNIEDIFGEANGVDNLSTSFRNLLMSMDKLSERSRNIREQLSQYEGVKAPTSEVDTSKYEDLTVKLNQNNNALTTYSIKAQEMLESIATSGHPVIEVFANITRSIAKATLALGRFTVSGAIKGLKFLTHHATKATISLTKMAGSSIRKGITSLSNAIKGLGKHTKSSNNMLQVGFKQFLRYGLGMRSVFTLIRKLRSALADGLKNLGSYDIEFGETITRFKEALETLKNSFASAFAPVIQVVLPILTQFIEKLSSVVSLVGRFIAALTGKTSFTQATRAQKQYKNAVDATGKSVKEAKKELYGFDEITKQQDDAVSSGNSGKTGSDKDDIVGGFETVPIEGWLKDLADKIRNFFSSKDWVGLGTFLGESINKLFQKAKDFLDNPALLNKIYEIIDAITTSFNSLVSAINWPLIGSTFASGINLIVKAVDRLVTEIDWKNIGKSIGNGLNALIQDIDWRKVGRTIGHALNIIPQTLSNFYATIDWKALGQNIAKGLNSLVNSIDWDSVAGWVYNKINAVFSVIGGFVRTFDWKGTASKIAKAFNNMIKNINWAEAGRVVSDSIKGIFSGIAKILEDVDWKAFGEKVKEYLVNIDWAGIAEALFEAIGAAIGGLAEFLWGLIEEAWNSVVGWWRDAAFEDGKFTIQGLLDGIVQALKNIGQWIKDHIFKPFIDGFKKAFGIASPSKEMKKLGGYIIEGVLQGILNGIKNIASWIVTNIFTPIKNGIVTAFGIAGDVAKNVINLGKSIIGGIKSGITNVISTIGSFIKTNVFTPIKNGLTTAFGVAGDIASGVVNIGKSIFEGVKKGISDAKNNVTSWFTSNVFTPVKDALTTAFDIAGGVANKLVSTGKSIVGGIKRGIENGWGGLTSRFTQIANTIKGAFTNTNWASIGSNICSGIARGIYNGWNWLVGYVKSLAKAMFRGAKSALGIHSPSTVFRDEVGKMIPAGLALGIEDNASKAINSVQELGKSITEEALGIKIPAIASGNVIPYNATNNSTAAQNSMVDSMLTKLAPIIQSALLNAISESDGFNVNFNVNGDPNKLFTVVREKGLQYQQVTGNPVFP